MNTQTYSKDSKNAIKGQINKVSKFVSKANPNQEEGKFTATVEDQTAKLPSMTWLGLAVGSMVGSAVILASSEKKEYANFVGLWAPCFLLIGIYNKLVKLEGNDKFNHGKGSSYGSASM